MNTLKEVLLSAVANLPNADCIRQNLIGKTVMTLTQKIVASLFAIANKERFGFYVAEEPKLIELIMVEAELPMTGESYREVKAKMPGLTIPLKGIGVEITQRGDFLTVWAPGVKK